MEGDWDGLLSMGVLVSDAMRSDICAALGALDGRADYALGVALGPDVGALGALDRYADGDDDGDALGVVLGPDVGAAIGALDGADGEYEGIIFRTAG